jgi:ribonuclease HI
VAESQKGLFAQGGKRAFILNVDGGSRGNPGPAAAAWVLRDASDGQVLIEKGVRVGEETNNRADYFALLFGLEDALALKADAVLVRSDSELMVRQMNGVYRVKNANLKPLYERAVAMSRRFKTFRITHVPREENRDADRMANAALDGKEAE